MATSLHSHADARAPIEACVHCDLPIPRARSERGSRFCCAGCEVVHGLLREEGLTRYYDLKNGPTAPVRTGGSSPLAWLDAAMAESPVDEKGTSCRLKLDVQGVH
ncbi:MAG: hypothetical protein HKN20_04335, partial [Gemmatimonadetes bacterium]|nr:hypothetical protein [Gemmatimonadota bacterium]